MSGLSTTGNISLGMALVAGKKRVPMPPTGNTALVILGIRVLTMMVPMMTNNQKFQRSTN